MSDLNSWKSKENQKGELNVSKILVLLVLFLCCFANTICFSKCKFISRVTSVSKYDGRSSSHVRSHSHGKINSPLDDFWLTAVWLFPNVLSHLSSRLSTLITHINEWVTFWQQTAANERPACVCRSRTDAMMGCEWIDQHSL